MRRTYTVRLPQSFSFVNHLKEVILKMKFGKIGLMCASLFLLSAVAATSFAQGNGAVAAGGARRQRQGGGQGQRGQRGGNPLVTMPLSVMDSYLKLTADQKTKITAIQTQYKTDAKAFTPAPVAPGEMPDRQAQQEMRTKQREASTKADTDIKAVLTEDQTKLIPDMNKELGSYTAVNIPVGVLPDLKLTADQKTKITTIAADSQKEMQAKFQEAQANGGQVDQAAMQEMRKASSDKVTAVLTDTQKTTLADYRKAHPTPQFGGRGGAGGGRRAGGAGAAPPPAH
ncbi:MAG: hypothetical protein JWN14_4877 [Chthonomonadales bacterium]|nr:hypothetical protein [Chthonomonadales bacterium]